MFLLEGANIRVASGMATLFLYALQAALMPVLERVIEFLFFRIQVGVGFAIAGVL